MQLATDTTDFADGNLGLVELALSFLYDRLKKNFSKSEMIVYINLEQKHLANLINSLYDTYYLTSATTDSVADQSTYALPSDAMQIWGIEVADSLTDDDPQKLTQVHMTDKYFYRRLTEVNNKEDMGFFWIAGTNFDLMPKDGAGGKKLRVFYVERLSDLSANADVSRIPAEHHELLALGAAQRGRAKLGRGNREIDKLYNRGIEALERSIAKYAPHWQETVEAFHGTYGPARTGSEEMI